MRWNHNIHYFPTLLDAVPPWATDALDVGCGEGVLTRALRRAVPRATGIDPDEPSIAIAREHGGDGIEYIVGDVLTHPFEPASFDVVVAAAMLHHVDAGVALARMTSLLRAGGLLGIIGLCRSRGIVSIDLPADIAAAVATRVLQRTGGREPWETPAPKVWPPPRTYAQEKQFLERELPGVRFRRRLLWRYTATWTKPG